MRTSLKGRAAIMQREGLRLRAYRDTKGILTIGVGHTGRAAPPAVHAGMLITRAQAMTILEADLAPMELRVTALLTRPVTQGQFDAVMSLVFNIGVENFEHSTVLRRINAGDVSGAANAILLWNKPSLLVARRRAERQQFLAGAASALPAPTPSKPPPVIPRPSAAPHPAKPVTLPPPVAADQPQGSPMSPKTLKLPFLAALLLALFAAPAARAADIDFGPLVTAGIEYFVVPLLGALLTWLVSRLAIAAKAVADKYPAYIDQKTAGLFADNVDAVLQKAISFGATQAQSYVGDRNLHANVDGWVASYAAKYAVGHAPDLMKQAGDISEKIVARLADHPGVQDLKAQIAATEPHAAAAAA